MDAKVSRCRRGARVASWLHYRIEIKRYGRHCITPLSDMQHSIVISFASHRLMSFLATALDMPFLLLPFRPTSDPSASRTFIRHYFDRSHYLYGEGLAQELRLTEPMVSQLMW